ncbi:MAG: Fe-S oxidoreductase, partial [Flavobacteriaceae bacterium]
MAYLPNLIFGLMLVGALALFVRNINRIRKNIALGRPMDRNDQKAARWKNMARIALGQSKMVTKPIAGLLHIVVYIGCLFINIELLEI